MFHDDSCLVQHTVRYNTAVPYCLQYSSVYYLFSNADVLFLFQEDHLKKLSSQVQKEEKKSDSARDSVTWNTVHEDDRAFPSLGLPSVLTGKEYFSTKQQEMDVQLQKLQNITENMEEDFRNTRLVSCGYCLLFLKQFIL